jgi:hypothetical protein
MNVIKSFWKAILWGMLIFLLSGISGDEMRELPLMTIHNIDKVGHFSFYLVFTFFIINGFVKFNLSKKPLFKFYLFSLLVAMMYGGMLEIMQRFVFIHRSADWLDFTANSSGALVAVLVYNLITRLLVKLRLDFILK